MTKIKTCLAGIVLVALVCLAHSLDFRELNLQETLASEHARTRFTVPYGEADCRLPRPVNETRVFLEWCDDQNKCWRSCSIEPRDPEVSRKAQRKRVLARN